MEMRLSLTLEEMENVLLLLFFGNLGYIPILMPNTGGALTLQGQMEQTHAVNHIVLLLVWSGIAWLLIRSRFRLRLNLFSAKAAFLYCATLTLPALLSRDIQTVVSTFVGFTLAAVYALFLIGRFPLHRLALMLGWAILLLSLGSVLFSIALPAYGLDHSANDHAWQGVFQQKNSLGLVMTFGVAIALAFLPINLMQRAWRLAILVPGLALIALSRSREAWVVCALLVAAHFFLYVHSLFARQSRGPALALCLIVAVIAGGLVAGNWTYLLGLLGRDATLSGRTQIWHAVIVECRKHLLFGHMGTGFWGTPAANNVYAEVGWVPTSSHNGFLELLLEQGLVGLVPVCLLLLLALRNAFKVLYSTPNYAESKVWIYLILVIVVFNCVQTTIGFSNSISWILLVCGACILEQRARLQRARVPGRVEAKRLTVAPA